MEQKKENTINAVNKKRVKNDASRRILVENTHEPIISKEIFYIDKIYLSLNIKKEDIRQHIYLLIFYVVPIMVKECILRKIKRVSL